MITVDFKRLDIQPGYRILDIGCGSGRHTCQAYRCDGVLAVGADLNFDDVMAAKKQLRLHDALGEHGNGHWALSTADVRSLPFKDDFFDLVICSEVLEHIPEDQLAVREIMRVLKPGNTLVVSVPRYLPERICWALSDDYTNANQGHVRIYKKKALSALLESEGAKIWSTRHAHSLHTPYWWLKCLVGPTREDSIPANLYHRFLMWDIMKRPKITRWLEDLLNPLIGKSLVVYSRKNNLG
ncbi:MAG: class I SAM-dependent methyltransferase [Deltaproteobacteria bacterium]|nr:MAG: class I SAM-dependent methyltransferase [Deltaproteobacteria bacterium]